MDTSRLQEALESLRAERERGAVRDDHNAQGIMHQAGSLLGQQMQQQQEDQQRAAQMAEMGRRQTSEQEFQRGESALQRGAQADSAAMHERGEQARAGEREAGEKRRHDEMMARLKERGEVEEHQFEVKQTQAAHPRPIVRTGGGGKAPADPLQAEANRLTALIKSTEASVGGSQKGYNEGGAAKSRAERDKLMGQLAAVEKQIHERGGGKQKDTTGGAGDLPEAKPGETVFDGPNNTSIVERSGKWVRVKGR